MRESAGDGGVAALRQRFGFWSGDLRFELNRAHDASYVTVRIPCGFDRCTRDIRSFDFVTDSLRESATALRMTELKFCQILSSASCCAQR